MAETDTASAPAITPNDDLGQIRRKTIWEANEPYILGIGFIVLVLVAWELIPRVVTLSRGMNLFFTTPSAVAVTLRVSMSTSKTTRRLRSTRCRSISFMTHENVSFDRRPYLKP